MTWNILEYNGQDTAVRNQYFRTVINHTQPDILVVEEMHTNGLALGFLNVMNSSNAGVYLMGTFINGFDTDNAVYFKPSKFQFINNVPIKTPLRDINDFILRYSVSNDTIHLLTVHLKAGNTMADENARSAEADSLRKYTNAFPVETNFFILGDYNLYRSDEQCYIKLKQVVAGNEGHGIDAVNLPGVWNNSAYSQYHTQSSRVRSFGGGATGGLDDRFDFILYSKASQDAGGVRILTNSITMVGNDGAHFNDSINKIPNNSVPQNVADALHYSSDHLPVHANIVFEPLVGIVQNNETLKNFILHDNYPNPFNPKTTLSFDISDAELVKLSVHNSLGHEVDILLNGEIKPGRYVIEFDGTNLSSGVYYYELRTEKFSECKKMILIK
jgi:endonuclease/exonuclease/phosphatase family metal-dependent hydrolase